MEVGATQLSPELRRGAVEPEQTNTDDMEAPSTEVSPDSPHLSVEQQLQFANSSDDFTRLRLARNPNVDVTVLERLARYEDLFDVIIEILQSPACTGKVRSLIASDWLAVADEHIATRATEDEAGYRDDIR